MSQNGKKLDEQLLENVSGGSTTQHSAKFYSIANEITRIYFSHKKSRFEFLREIKYWLEPELESRGLEPGEREELEAYILELAQRYED